MKNHSKRISGRIAAGLLGTLLSVMPSTLLAEDPAQTTVEVDLNRERVSISLRDVPLAEAVELLSRRARRNIILADGIEGTVSVNLYDVTIDQAIRVIAEGAGHTMEFRNNTWYIIKRDDVGKYTASGQIVVRAFGIQYSDVETIEGIIKEHLSQWGNVTTMKDRGMLVVRDQPEFVNRIARLINEIDRQPQQVLIEVRLLEITLDDTQAAGVNWGRDFNTPGNKLLDLSAGTATVSANTATIGSTGLLFDLITPELGLTLEALENKGRVRTISTPTLLAIENQESRVLIGDRLGYSVTVTNDGVSTESIEFIDSGVILRVTVSVDRDDNVLMSVNPQVSSGTFDLAGIPQISTTEVTTTLLIPDGQTTFIGGLLRQRLSESRDGIPFLSDLPLIGGLFGSESKANLRTETVALITPYIVRDSKPRGNKEKVGASLELKRILDGESTRIDAEINESRSGFLHPANPSAPEAVPEAAPEPPAPAARPAPTDTDPMVPKVRVTPLPDASQSIRLAPGEPDLPPAAASAPEPPASKAAVTPDKATLVPATTPPSPAAATQPATPVPAIVPVALPAELPTGRKADIEDDENPASDPIPEPGSAPESEPAIDTDIERLMRIWGQSARR